MYLFPFKVRKSNYIKVFDLWSSLKNMELEMEQVDKTFETVTQTDVSFCWSYVRTHKGHFDPQRFRVGSRPDLKSRSIVCKNTGGKG